MPPTPSNALKRSALVWVLAGCCLPVSLAWAQSTATVAAPPAPAVRTARLDAVWEYPWRSAPAQVVARNESRLASEVGGTLLRWTADVGASVKAGEVLAQIDPADLELALQRADAARAAAQARLNLGEAQLARARELVQQGFFSQEALAQRDTEVALQKAELDQAQAQWQTAKRQRDKATLRAPFAGTVVQRLAQQDYVVRVAVRDPAGARFLQTQGRVGQIVPLAAPVRRAQERRFEPQGESTDWPLTLLRVTPTVQPGSRTQTARLTFQSQDPPPTGSSGVLRWRDPTPHVPATLLVRRGSGLGVFVQSGTQARFVALPRAEEGRAAPIELPADTTIVVQGQAALRDGQPLN